MGHQLEFLSHLLDLFPPVALLVVLLLVSHVVTLLHLGSEVVTQERVLFMSQTLLLLLFLLVLLYLEEMLLPNVLLFGGHESVEGLLTHLVEVLLVGGVFLLFGVVVVVHEGVHVDPVHL